MSETRCLGIYYHAWKEDTCERCKEKRVLPLPEIELPMMIKDINGNLCKLTLVPKGTDTARPSTPERGVIRPVGEQGMEIYDGNAWVDIRTVIDVDGGFIWPEASPEVQYK